ncbi:MAG: hypothetical protein ACHQ6T_02780 [Myxococcota bacterium]
MRSLTAWVCAGFAAGAAAVSSAASLVVLEDARYVAFNGGSLMQPAPGQSLFDASAGDFYGYSQQTSTLAADHFSGSGSIFSEFPLADDVFNVLFTVDSATSFVLTGQLSSYPTPGTASFSDSTGATRDLTGAPDGSFSLGGSLLPAVQYRLVVAAQSSIGAQYNFNLAVPEPALAALALLGATASLLTRSSSRSRSRTARRSGAARSRGSRP